MAGHGHHPGRSRDIRWIYLHMIEKYARHNGHTDLIRERIYGDTGDRHPRRHQQRILAISPS